MAGNYEGKRGGGFMAVEKVTASMAENSSELDNVGNDTYSGGLLTPSAGVYNVSVAAYDDAGNVAVAKSDESVIVEPWGIPKVNWTKADSFNMADYNRIKNNLQLLHDKAVEICAANFELEDMGEDIVSVAENWKPQYFNAWEANLALINQKTYQKDIGESLRFFPHGPFITPDELNRIENACLEIMSMLEREEKGLRRIPFRLGAFKEVRI